MKTIPSSGWAAGWLAAGAAAANAAVAVAVVTLAPLSLLCGCNDAPTMALVENNYPLPADAGAGTMTVFKAWWVTTLFATPVAPGEVSETERTIPSTDFAYALLALDWSASSNDRPRRLIALRSRQKLSVAAHDLLRIVVSDDQFNGNCAAGAPLDAQDAQFIVERIFPGDFAGLVYDPSNCETVPSDADAGADAAAGN